MTYPKSGAARHPKHLARRDSAGDDRVTANAGPIATLTQIELQRLVAAMVD
ncbi:hypothetical protein RXV95_08270 [Novosphingobium sp. ZN18A2]|uniref:hypothetical protein n=1 Tax=Novosphingobium sp. ZN18A2 TaxID=3079861 RepID=UPI0030D58F15